MKTFGSSVRLPARKVALIVVAVFVVMSLISVFSINLSDRASNEAALYKANYSIDKNGVYTISPKKGYDGFSSLTISVDVAGASVPASYTVSSVDELPSDAVDGSMAIVQYPHEVLGTWVLNDTPAMGNFSANMDFMSNGKSFNGFSTYGSLVYTDDAENPQAYSADNGWLGEGYKTLTITKIKFGDDVRPINWLKNNGVQTEAGIGQSLYSRENGEWVYKCEIQ